jgi:anti-sigma B factor antagonist
MSVSGRVDSATAPDLESSLKKLVESDKTQIVLDLKDVEYMSSAGLRAMVSTLKAVKRVNGDLRLANPSPRVEEVLRLAGLTSIFSIHPTQDEAVASF